MDGRKLRDYYLSFYAPKFLIPISRSRLSVVMSHFLISARSDYYAIEPLYKTLISRYMSCGGELATFAALFLASVASPWSRTTLGDPSYSQVDYCSTNSLFLTAVTDSNSSYYSTPLLYSPINNQTRIQRAVSAHGPNKGLIIQKRNHEIFSYKNRLRDKQFKWIQKKVKI